jgi:UPF0755 protein
MMMLVACAPSDGDLLVKATPFPTPISPEDIPLGLWLQQHAQDLNSPVSNDQTPINFRVLPGELPTDVGPKLASAGLVKSSELFVNWVKYQHIGQKIQAGEYVLKKSMTVDDIATALQHGRARTISVTIRPGWRTEEVADNFATQGLINFNKDTFLKLAREGKFDYAFLKDRPKNAPPSLEGYLLPETYNVPFDITTDNLIVVILDTFNQRVTDAMRQKAAAQKITLYEAITLASIIEREAVVDPERPIIASVFLNRIKKKMFLQSDSTAQYVIGYQTATKQWWKSPVTIDELTSAKSPYNTYLNPGLPPGPICNPSLASIVGALEPAQTDYLFFFSKGDGTHVFAKTFDEHLQNQQKYQK